MTSNNKYLEDAMDHVTSAYVALYRVTGKGEKLQGALDALNRVFRVIRQEIQIREAVNND